MGNTFKSKSDIKEEVNLLDYVLLNGYLIDKVKSTPAWVKLHNDAIGDTIMIMPKKNMYYNLDGSLDKGDVLQFVANRINNSVSIDNSNESFYKTMVKLNAHLGHHQNENNNDILKNKSNFFKKKETLSSLQDKEWNHLPIVNFKYLTQERGIDLNVLKLPLFEGRLFNTYFHLPNGHIITNSAFGKYKKEELVGLEVRNSTIKTIIGDHDGVFYTNTKGMKNIEAVFYAESGIDLASYIEILYSNPNFDKSRNCCFLSFSGNLYESKMKTIIDKLHSFPLNDNCKFISLTDNDFDKEESKKPGKNYDVEFSVALINSYITPLLLETNDLFYNLSFTDKETINIEAIKEIIYNQNELVDQLFTADERYGKYAVLKNSEEKLIINLPKSLPLDKNSFIDIISCLNAKRLYIPHKPLKTNDWNEELKKRKKLEPVKRKEKEIIGEIKKKSNGNRL